MNLYLLWIDALALVLLWVAAIAALVARVRLRWVRGLVMWVAVIIPLLPLAVLVFGTGTMQFSSGGQPNLFHYLAALLLAFLIGTGLILHQARRPAPGLAPRAAEWRRLPLLLAWLAAAAIGYTTLVNMDLALRARCAFLSTEVNSVYLASLPAITYESQNAAPLYEQAFAQLDANRAAEESIQSAPTGNKMSFDANEPAAVDFLKQEAPTIALLRRAAALPACRFDEDLAEPDIDSVLPPLNRERNLANVLCLDACEELSRGHAAVALADTTAVLRISRHFGQRPLLVSSLVALGIDAIGKKMLELALPAVEGKEQLDALQIDDLQPMNRCFQQAMRGEERYGLLIYGSFAPMTPHGSLPAVGKGVGSSTGWPGVGIDLLLQFTVLDLDAYARYMQSLQGAAVKPYYQAAEQIRGGFGQVKESDLMLRIAAPSFALALATLGRCEAADACDLAAIAMTRYRLDHGKLPDKLDDLVPAYLDAVPLDPFAGHPLRLAIRDGAHIIYSVGPGLKDQGGVVPEHGSRRDGNVIFRLRDHGSTATTMPWD